MLELAHLANLKQTTNGCAWLSQLPSSVERVCKDWQLVPDKNPYPDSTVSYVLPAKQNGVPVVVKFQWPHDECVHEAEALRQWNGVAAVRLLAHNPAEHALLLERCDPGQSLATDRRCLRKPCRRSIPLVDGRRLHFRWTLYEVALLDQ